MEDGLIGTSGQSVEVNVDRVNKREEVLVRIPGRGTVGETAMDMIGRHGYATLEDKVLVCHDLFYSSSCNFAKD